MKFLLLFLLGSVLICLSKQQTRNMLPVLLDADPNCKQIGVNCEGTVLRYCDKDNNAVFTQDCSTLNPSQTCCEGLKMCSQICDPNEKPKFYCTMAGNFPDPTNCMGYFYCDENLISTDEICMNGMQYDPSQGSCDSSMSCVAQNIDCTVAVSGVFEEDPEFFWNCFSSVPNSPYTVQQCPTNHTYVTTSKPAICVFMCKDPGNYPYPGDKKKYNHCDSDSGPATVFTCAANNEFDEMLGKCAVPKSTLSTSSTSTTSTSTTSAPTTTSSTTSAPTTTSSTTTKKPPRF